MGSGDYTGSGTAPGPGARIGRYELLADLGSGGMASVYLARIVGPGTFRKLVALKKIHPHLAERRDVVEMFVDEASLAARITHPNTCAVIDFGEVDGVWYLAMEYLEGASLSTILRASMRYLVQTSDARREYYGVLCRVVGDACKGLHAAHEAIDERGAPLDIVHRDVSPDNVFVTYNGVAKVVDFGIATGRGRLHQTSTGVMKGKIGYLAPETFGVGDMDRRVDIWSVGVVLWEGLCLERLFRTQNPARTMSDILARPIPRPSRLQPGVPQTLDAVVERALERDPSRRWPTAAALAEALERACRNEGLLVSESDVVAWVDRVLPGHREALRAELHRALEDTDSSKVRIPKPPQGNVPEVSRDDSADPDVPTRSLCRPDAQPVGETDIVLEIDVSHLASSTSVPIAPAALEPGRPRPLFWCLVGLAMAAVFSLSYVTAGMMRAGGGSGALADPVASLIGGTVSASASEPAVVPVPSVATSSPDHDVAPRVADAVDAGVVFDGSLDLASPERAKPSGPKVRPRVQRRDHDDPGRPDEGSPRFGDVRIATPGGWAEVYYRGQRLASHTPTTVRLPTGRQVLELRFRGSPQPRRVSVDVQEGRSVAVVEHAP